MLGIVVLMLEFLGIIVFMFGFMIVYGNCLDDLCDFVVFWMCCYLLVLLESEWVLVYSNGIV